MAVTGAGIEALLSRLLSRERGKPILRPNKPLVLKDEVANKKTEKGEASCITEMSILMACWKKKDFNSSLCSKEISDFYSCVGRAERRKARQQAAVGQGKKMLPKQANVLLKRYPNLGKEI
ncbi:coiled-coil-helix-coiled-coil-helix domain-containing protein 1 [Astyanax mexicanus]|uniref:Coiled-coil-helix-coiled-coil-helix domain containing 1 n=1 Tax=Astyanax mexicanus TaxID=7994 RepID=A0A3B1K224_ASTMX|nr:coiled-coil-helix-coiled-coil-helix domain-containing protein 1 [Astyanax mexicanus]